MQSKLLKRLRAMQRALNNLTLSCIVLNCIMSKMINALYDGGVEGMMVFMSDFAEALTSTADNFMQFQNVSIGLTGDLNELQE